MELLGVEIRKKIPEIDSILHLYNKIGFILKRKLNLIFNLASWGLGLKIES